MAAIFKPSYTKLDAETGRRVRQKGTKWHIRFRDADGILRRVPGYRDKEATRQLAAELEKRAALQASGVVDRYAEHRKRPLREHLEDFRAFLASKGNTPKHVALVASRVGAVLEGCGFVRMGDLDAARLSSWLAEKRSKGLSAQTANFYLGRLEELRPLAGALAAHGGEPARASQRRERPDRPPP